MKLYHFSDKYFDPDEFIQIGHFKKTITQSGGIVEEFEMLLEESRQLITSAKISRLNCLFTFPKNVADGFKTNRKFLYELELTDDVQTSSHNHEIGTYFQKLFKLNDINYFKDEQNLIDTYWSNTQPFKDSNGIEIGFGEEILVDKPLQIKRTILINKLSKKEFLDFNLPLYHITPTKNVDEILQNGIEKRNGIGICFVQKKHPLVIRYIVEMMLISEGDSDFSIIEIIPKNYEVTSSELINDNVEEGTNGIHNYILRDNISITKDNIIGNYKANPLGIPDLKEFENELKEKGLLMPLN